MGDRPVDQRERHARPDLGWERDHLHRVRSLDGSDPTGQTAYAYVDGAVTVGGSSIGCVKNITISGANNLISGRHVHRPDHDLRP